MYHVVLSEVDERYGPRPVSRWGFADKESANRFRDEMTQTYRNAPRVYVSVSKVGTVFVSFPSGSRQMITVERG